MKREKLIQVLREMFSIDTYTTDELRTISVCANYFENTIADFILSRERLLLEKIGKPLYQWQSTQQKLVNCQCYICQALAIIEKEGSV